MVRSLLIRGMLVGLLAGVVGFAFAFAVGEPQLERAIAFEQQARPGAAQHDEVDVVSRDVQRTVGLLTGTVAIGVALGGLFALAFVYSYGRIGVRGARMTSRVLAAAAFVTVALVPFIKYPPNPPGVGSPATLESRTILFVAMIAIALAALVAAARVRAQYLDRLGPWNAALLGAGAFAALVALAQLILPDVDAAPAGFPADVLFEFRLAALGLSAIMWLTIGLAFGALAERLLASARGAGGVRA